MAHRRKDNAKAAGPPGDAQVVETPPIAEAAAEVSEIHETVATAAAGFPIVGIGVSAGGLAAFEAFFSGMPAGIDPGVATEGTP